MQKKRSVSIELNSLATGSTLNYRLSVFQLNNFFLLSHMLWDEPSPTVPRKQIQFAIRLCSTFTCLASSSVNHDNRDPWLSNSSLPAIASTYQHISISLATTSDSILPVTAGV